MDPHCRLAERRVQLRSLQGSRNRRQRRKIGPVWAWKNEKNRSLVIRDQWEEGSLNHCLRG